MGGDMRGELRAGRWETAGDRGARSVQERAPLQIGSTGHERTENRSSMPVTLDVSRLSGWLNALAFCRATRGVICGLRRREGVGRCAGGNTVQERTQLDNWQHLKHVAHARDAGRVKA